MRVLSVVPGPEQHGVVQHALTVARLVADAGADVTVVRGLEVQRADVVHVPFTDALWGPSVDAASRAFTAWARTAPRPLVVTLHDVPGLDADSVRDARRRTGFRRVAAAADAVVVSAEHEVGGARTADGPEPVVVPLPVEPLVAPGPRPVWTDRPTLGVLGFVYPGKGHAEVVRAAAGTGARVVALGAASPGHGELVASLHRLAADLRVELLVTGALPEADLHAAARAVTVPVAAYRTIGASASLSTWLACGRRAVTTDATYPRELLARWPGSLLLHHPADLRDTLVSALAAPATTWLSGAPPRPDVGAAHLAVYLACVAAVSRTA